MLVLGLVDVPWWALLLLAFLGYVLYLCRNFNYFRKQGVPGETPYPILGNLLPMFTECLAYRDMKTLKKYGDIGYCGEFIASEPSLLVFDANMLSEIMVKEFTSFQNRMTFKGNDEITDSMLLNLENEHWKLVRNEMTPTFTTGKLKRMNSEINRCAKTLADNLLERAKLHENVEMKEYTGGYTMDVIASTAFGIRVDSQKDRNNAFVTNARTAFEFRPANPTVILRIFFPEIAFLLMRLGVQFDFFPRDIKDFFHGITTQTMDMRRADDDQSRTDFIQLMINAQRGENIKDHDDDDDSTTCSEKSSHFGITTNEILANAMLFFVAGYDTTSTSLSFLLYNLALHPDCQDRLFEEINRVIGKKETVDYSLLQEMPYLEQCINENLRMYPPAIRVNRRANRDATINGIFIRKGVNIDIPIYAIHHDPKKWPEPDMFDPERFNTENKKDRNPYHFLPFGNGPRNCIGMRLALQELKVAAIHVLKKVKVIKCDKTEVPIKFAKNGGLLKAEGGIWLKVEPRTGE